MPSKHARLRIAVATLLMVVIALAIYATRERGVGLVLTNGTAYPLVDVRIEYGGDRLAVGRLEPGRSFRGRFREARESSPIMTLDVGREDAEFRRLRPDQPPRFPQMTLAIGEPCTSLDLRIAERGSFDPAVRTIEVEGAARTRMTLVNLLDALVHLRVPGVVRWPKVSLSYVRPPDASGPAQRD